MNLVKASFTAACLFAAASASAQVKVTVEHNEGDKATEKFTFKTVPAPSKDDAGEKATFSIVDGEADGNGAGIEAVHDGKVPSEEDEPASNFFFNQGIDGGRIAADLGSVIPIKQVNTYSWHTDTRAPQVYKLYAADGKATGFNAAPKNGTDPASVGWKLIASVDTRPKGDAEGGGQYGVSIADASGSLGSFRYVLFDVKQTESDDQFGNTFYSEIDIVSDAKPATTADATKDAENATQNTLTIAEKAAGWQLLFDGKSTDGWHDYKKDSIQPGWKVENGELECVDPHHAGDLCTDKEFGSFELAIDYKISVGGNSGIMFHVTKGDAYPWQSGPECQLLDNVKGEDPQKAGWLYQFYKTDVDATKPAGEWNHVVLLITKEKCSHTMNGVKYFEYDINSQDFQDRLAKSKFAKMPHFAKSWTGSIALQGDHGVVSFRNIKIRPIEEK